LTATKSFDVSAGSTENMWYRIEVRFRGATVDTFLTPTMREAWDAFERAGYRQSGFTRLP
jgi:hypothetical protein